MRWNRSFYAANKFWRFKAQNERRSEFWISTPSPLNPSWWDFNGCFYKRENMWKEFRRWSYITVILIDTCYWSSAYLLAQSLFNLIIFPKDRSIRYVGTGDTSQNRLCYISDKNNKPRRKEYLLRNILKSFVIGLTIIFLEALTAAKYVQEFIW